MAAEAGAFAMPGRLGQAPFVARARAKINLSLHVLGRRADGYHELESLVAFAGVGDTLSLTPGRSLSLTISGPMAAGLDVSDDNLVLRAARNLAAHVPGLAPGAFHLVKRLPVASGIGGGSADAAAGLRLLARLNGLKANDPRLMEAARETGADVPACLISRSLIMRGTGEALEPVTLPRLFAVLANPGVAVPTAAVFGELGLARGESLTASSTHAMPPSWSGLARPYGEAFDGGARDLITLLTSLRNDLETPAIRHAPIIGHVLATLRDQAGCRLARMSGSGATCFALFDDCRASAAAAKRLAAAHPGWWVKATALG